MGPPPSATPIMAALQKTNYGFGETDKTVKSLSGAMAESYGLLSTEESAEQPRREESIFSLLNNARPMTAMVRVDSKTGEVQTIGPVTPSGAACKGGAPDIWVAGDSDDDGRGSFDEYDFEPDGARKEDDDSGHNKWRRSFEDESSTIREGILSSREREEQAWFTANTNSAPSFSAAKALSLESPHSQEATATSPLIYESTPPRSPSSPSQSADGAVRQSPVAVAPSGPRKTNGAIVVSESSDLLRSASASSVGSRNHPPHHALSNDPSEFWLSTGLIPQLLAIDFVHDVQLESVTVEAWGIEKISIILEGRSPPPLSRARHLGETSRHLPTLEFSDDLEFELQRVDLRNIHAGACQRVYLRIDGALTDFVAVRKVEVTGRPLISP